MKKIAFIGLGNMGLPMAMNLVSAGFEVYGYDLVPDAVKHFVNKGGKTCDAMRARVSQVDAVVSMLPAGKHVSELYLGKDGLLSHLPDNGMVIDCSTIEAAIARQVATAAQSQGVAFIDAPVSGGIAGAKAGSLTFMVGGTEQHLKKARPCLETMGQAIFHAGAPGAGQLAKICNNLLLAVLMTGTSEALKLGMDNGLDPAVLSDIMKKSSGGNWVLEKYNPVPGVMPAAPASHEYQGGFMTRLMTKDLSLALGAGAASKTPTPMGALASQLYQLHATDAGDSLDFSSIFTFYHRN